MANQARFVSIDPSWLAAFQARARLHREEQAAERAKLQKPFVIEVAKCACGGKVNFHFEGFQYTGSLSDLRIGGSNPTTEIFSCVCESCGQTFDRNHPPIAEVIARYRASL